MRLMRLMRLVRLPRELSGSRPEKTLYNLPVRDPVVGWSGRSTPLTILLRNNLSAPYIRSPRASLEK
jgi:hypothetical protein